ncbi:MAG TPA: MBL fold metallo-hydrolase [Myxococcota bacterium]|nr:MBL fold metallo-hydrolase [Myxococcota bacterium]
MRVCIHRGAKQIGGTCIELESRGSRLVLDLGLPLDAGVGFGNELPLVAGLAAGDDPDLLGVVISHPHPDHWGLLPLVPDTVPVFIGSAALVSSAGRRSTRLRLPRRRSRLDARACPAAGRDGGEPDVRTRGPGGELHVLARDHGQQRR